MQQTLECGPFLPSSHHQAQAHMINRQEKHFGAASLRLRSEQGVSWLRCCALIGSRVQCPLTNLNRVATKKEKHQFILEEHPVIDYWQTSKNEYLLVLAAGGKSREKWGSLTKSIKKNNQESNSDGDPWLERPGSGCCSTSGISGARKGHASCCRALPHPLLALTLQVIPYTCPTYSIF